MAHFAQINENNIVEWVIVIDNNKENDAENFIKNELKLPGKWIKTSYNTHGGIYYISNTNIKDPDQSKSFRKNFAGVGYLYDEQRDAFISPKPYPSWILDEDTCWWEAPVPKPETEGPWIWNEEEQKWEKITQENIELNPPVND